MIKFNWKTLVWDIKHWQLFDLQSGCGTEDRNSTSNHPGDAWAGVPTGVDHCEGQDPWDRRSGHEGGDDGPDTAMVHWMSVSWHFVHRQNNAGHVAGIISITVHMTWSPLSKCYLMFVHLIPCLRPILSQL